jgi:histidine ammonia-lyase
VLATLREAGWQGPGPDRFLAPEIEYAVRLVASSAVLRAVEAVTGPLA